jgi:hypothetical protein
MVPLARTVIFPPPLDVVVVVVVVPGVGVLWHGKLDIRPT